MVCSWVVGLLGTASALPNFVAESCRSLSSPLEVSARTARARDARAFVALNWHISLHSDLCYCVLPDAPFPHSEFHASAIGW